MKHTVFYETYRIVTSNSKVIFKQQYNTQLFYPLFLMDISTLVMKNNYDNNVSEPFILQ